MDALTEVLNSVRVRSTVYCPIEIGAPWGLFIPEEDGASFCILVKGSAFLVIEELNIRRYLKAGDFIIITKKCPCKVSDSPESEFIELQEWLRRNPPRPDGTYKVEGEGEVTNFIGGTFFFENHESHPLLKVLPTFLHFSGTGGKTGEDGKVVGWFETTLDFIFFAQDTPPINASFWVAQDAPPLSQVEWLWYLRRMSLPLSIKAKLVRPTSPGQELKSAREEFNRACNPLSELAFQQALHRKSDLHHAGYRLIREEATVPAQHGVNAIAQGSAAYTRNPKKFHPFNPHSSVRSDARTRVLGQDSYTASLTVCPKGGLTGRLQMAAKLRKRLGQGELGAAELVSRKRRHTAWRLVGEKVNFNGHSSGHTETVDAISRRHCKLKMV